MPTTLPPFPDDMARLASADLARLVGELRAENAQLRAELGQLPSAAQSLIDDQKRRASLLTQLAIEFREALDPGQIVEQTLRALAAHMQANASVILVGAERAIELAIMTAEGGVGPIGPELARSVVEDGLAGWVIRHGSSVALADVARDRRWVQLSEQHRSGSVIVIPIRQVNQTLGALTAHRPAVNAFSSHDLILLEGVAAQLGVALSAARNQASERQRREQAMALLTMTQFLSAERRVDELAAMLSEQGAAVFGASHALLFLSGDEGPQASLRPVMPGPAERWAAPLELATGAAQLAWAGKRTVTTAPQAGLTCVALPLNHHGVTIGSFVLVHPGQGGFSASLWSLLTVFTHIVAAACASAQLVGRLTEQASALERLVAQRTRQMQHSRDALRVVFDNMSEGVILLDDEERLVAANQFFCATIIGRHPRELVGQSYARVWQMIERQAHVRVELAPGRDPGGQQLKVRVGSPPQGRVFSVRRTPVDCDGQRAEQYLEYWIASGEA